MAHILIIEDNIEIHEMIVETLTKNAYQTTSAYSGSEGRLLMKLHEFDLILLDLMLPGISGEDLLTEIRREHQVPIIVISAKDAIDSKVKLLQAGADDYLVKPFDLKELVARIQVALKHSNANIEETIKIYQVSDLKYLPEEHQIMYQDQELQLTPQEYKILSLLIQYPKKIFTKQEIYEYAWGDCYIGEDKTITVHISNIRKKLNYYSQEDWIETVWGIGFRLNPNL